MKLSGRRSRNWGVSMARNRTGKANLFSLSGRNKKVSGSNLREIKWMRKCGRWDFSVTTMKKIRLMKGQETKSSEIIRITKGLESSQKKTNRQSTTMNFKIRTFSMKQTFKKLMNLCQINSKTQPYSLKQIFDPSWTLKSKDIMQNQNSITQRNTMKCLKTIASRTNTLLETMPHPKRTSSIYLCAEGGTRTNHKQSILQKWRKDASLHSLRWGCFLMRDLNLHNRSRKQRISQALRKILTREDWITLPKLKKLIVLRRESSQMKEQNSPKRRP